jgi:outer membrane protein OmpA-like peptidoglycan-associated protein
MIMSLRFAAFLFAAGLIAAAAPARAECDRAGGHAGAPTVVHFDTGSTVIKPQFQHDLAEVAAQNRGNPNIKICITGQADNQGNPAYNEKLALARANAVADQLAKDGLPRSQFDISGRGEAFDGLLSGDPAESDRRVEVLIVRY